MVGSTGCGGDAAEAPAPIVRFEPVDLELEGTTEAGHQHVTTFAFVPGTNQLLLAELHGDVYHYEIHEGAGTLLGHFSLSDYVYPPTGFDGDCGLISLAFDPDFADNGYFYAGVCFDASSTGIVRFTFDFADPGSIASSGAIIMRETLTRSSAFHNVGQLGFDQDGYLWALYGDGSRSDLASDPSSNFGSLVRIEPSRDPEGAGYVPAPGNPFIGDPEASDDVYAYGFRSPWTGYYDAFGRWWVGDVGSGGDVAVEEINVVTGPGDAFGWPMVEGPCEGPCEGLTDPVRHWDHSSSHPYVTEMHAPYPSQNRVGWVGVAYEDRGPDRYAGMLTDRVLYGEMCVGFVRAMDMDETGEIVSDGLVGELPKVSAWGQGADGYLYATTYGACEARRDVPDVPAGLWRAVLDVETP